MLVDSVVLNRVVSRIGHLAKLLPSPYHHVQNFTDTKSRPCALQHRRIYRVPYAVS